MCIREIQIKTTVRYHLTPVRMAKISKSGNDRCWWRCRERGNFLHCWWECKLVEPHWKTVWRVLKKLKIELPYNPAIVLLGIYPKDTNVVIWRGMCTWMFIVAMSTIAILRKETRCLSTDEWIKKMWYTYTHIPHIFIQSSVNRHLGSFHSLAILDIAAINIGVQVFLQITTFLHLW